MAASELQPVVRMVLQRAEQQGYVLARDIRAELKQAGLKETRWAEVVEQLRESLHLRSGRYHFIPPVRPHLQAREQQLQAVQQAIRTLVELQQQAEARHQNRREAERVPFIHTVTCRTEEAQQLTLLSRDLSVGGIRLIATRSFLGQKLTVELPQGEALPPCAVVVRILWTAMVADGLFENGGKFVEMVASCNPAG